MVSRSNVTRVLPLLCPLLLLLQLLDLASCQPMQPQQLQEVSAASPMYFLKRAGFVGMRGKKDNHFVEEDDDETHTFDDQAKRNAAGFVGMRGKKEDHDENSNNSNNNENNLEWLTQLAKSLNFHQQKRAGFVGMRGKKSGEEVDKRAGFVGMRGKKLQHGGRFYWSALPSSFNLKMRRASGGASGFVGMRG